MNGSFSGQPRLREVLAENRARTSPKINPGLWTSEPRLCRPDSRPDSISCQVRAVNTKGGFPRSPPRCSGCGRGLVSWPGRQRISKMDKEGRRCFPGKERKSGHCPLQPLWSWGTRGGGSPPEGAELPPTAAGFRREKDKPYQQFPWFQTLSQPISDQLTHASHNLRVQVWPTQTQERTKPASAGSSAAHGAADRTRSRRRAEGREEAVQGPTQTGREKGWSGQASRRRRPVV